MLPDSVSVASAFNGEGKPLNVGYTPLQAQWWALLRDIRRPEFELTPEEFAPLWTTFVQLLGDGYHVDPMLQAVLILLARQVIGTDDDSDADDADAWLDLDDAADNERTEDDFGGEGKPKPHQLTPLVFTGKGEQPA